MVLELSKDAVELKLKSSFPSILVSEYEYCYAAGLLLRYGNADSAQAAALRQITSFEELRDKMTSIAKGFSFTKQSREDKLKEMIQSCTLEGKMNDDSRALFDMGYNNK